MVDSRLKKMCNTLVNYSTNVQKGEKVWINVTDCPGGVAAQLIKEVAAAGGIPFCVNNHLKVQRGLINNACAEQMELLAKVDSALMAEMDAFIGVRGADNASELGDVDEEKMQLYRSVYYNKVHFGIRIPKTKWVVLRYPTSSMAQMANTSTEAFEDFYFDVCNLDYSKMDKAMDALQKKLNSTDKVRIVGPGTDLAFSIKGIGSKKCSGHMNIPDGEVYSAPVRDSVNGVIHYNTPSLNQGFKYEDIRFEFKDGKIVKATANDTDRINKVLDTDEGARYVGEFAMGVNPYIKEPMLDTLFDEKICGSIHFTPGAAYDDADNGNKSSVHWDLVLIQRPEYGGGEIYFDDELVRKDGKFLGELEVLNPENLK